MPYLSGGSLADRVAQFGPRPPDEVAAIAAHLLDALAAAHRAGVVHRDVKPANVLFAADGRPLLADFGVARAEGATAGLTLTDLVVGTPGFMAPEQARGEPATSASDVFSLGATLLFAATGQGPFGEGPPHVLLWRAARAKLEPIPRMLPKELRRNLAAMLDPRSERRPTAAAARGGPEGTWTRTAPGWRAQARRRRAGWAAAAVLAAASIVAAVAVVDRADHPAASDSLDGPATRATVAPVACIPLLYQPCGAPAAPFTDGQACTNDHADYDGDAVNGCEAAPDAVDGDALEDDPLQATIVPAVDIDQYPLQVSDHYNFRCNGTLSVTLTAPVEVTLRLELLDHGDVIGQAVSADGQPGMVRLRESNCGSDDSTTLVARVSPIGSDRSAGMYTLERSGSY
jgi:hypothetical protein